MSAFVSAGAFARALGITPKQLGRLAASGRMPAALRASSRGWRRWTVADARRALEARGFPVPASWPVEAEERAA